MRQILHIGNFTLRLKSLAATALCRILEQARCCTWSDRLATMKWSQFAGLVLCMMGLYQNPTQNPLLSYNFKMALQITWACRMMPNNRFIILVGEPPCGSWRKKNLVHPFIGLQNPIMHFYGEWWLEGARLKSVESPLRGLTERSFSHGWEARGGKDEGQTDDGRKGLSQIHVKRSIFCVCFFAWCSTAGWIMMRCEE